MASLATNVLTTTRNGSQGQMAMMEPTIVSPWQPHILPNVVPTDVPRVHSFHQPAEERQEFKKLYPNGIPVSYKMVYDSNQGPPRKYLEDSVSMGFYTNPPKNARAIFSTGNGTREFRKMDHILPKRHIPLWSKDEIQMLCNSTRKIFWEFMKPMRMPVSWDCLWEYFDSYDLYHYGLTNLWNLINNLYAENVIIYSDVMSYAAVEIGHWIEQWSCDPDNRTKLVTWSPHQAPIFLLLTQED